MNGYRESVLIYSSELDLKHLSDFLEPESFSCSFAASTEEFSEKCRYEKFSAIVLAISSNQKIEETVLNSISWSRNMFTPIMVVTSMLPDHFADQLIRYGFETIMFPFSDREFFFRLRKMIRQKQNEEAVHTNLLNYRSLFDNFPVGIVQTSHNGDFTSVNPAFTEIMEMSEQELLKENFFRMCHPDDYLIMRKQLDRLLKKESRIVKFETRLITNDGKSRVCKIVTAAIWDGGESFYRFTFVIENII